ncbi:MAG: hypothetical protein L0Y36_00095 [Planctomycetales bacterium]|nr:hypothetical protein [Planctomycetales bacterium]
MKTRLLNWYHSLDRFEQVLLAGVLIISVILIPLLILFACAGGGLIQSVYEQRSLPFLNRLIQHHYPLDHYLAMRKDMAVYLFVLWVLFCVIGVSGLMFLNRFFFSEGNVSVPWFIFICCLASAFLFQYNTEWKVMSNHGFFRAGMAYQIINGNWPPMDPLFGGEILHYEWGYPWAGAQMSKLFNVSPFTSFAVINLICHACCLLLLYKISNLLIDAPKVNIFSAFFTLYCLSTFHRGILTKLEEILPIYSGILGPFPLIHKFLNINGMPLGLVFFLLTVYSGIKLFERKHIRRYGLLVFISSACCIFFYAGYVPGIVAWVGLLCLVGLVCYKKETAKSYRLPLICLAVSVFISLLATAPYLRQVSAVGAVSDVVFFHPFHFVQNVLNFLVPSILVCLVVFIFRKFLMDNLNRIPLFLVSCLFVSVFACYLFIHYPYTLEYKFLYLALVPFGIVSGIAFMRIQHYSKWLALGLFLISVYPSLKIYEYLIERSPRNLFDVEYNAPFYEKGMCLESSDSEENSMYRWIRANASMTTYFVDAEVKIPVYAQRSLWVVLDNDIFPPGYGLHTSRFKYLHGYDLDEYSRRQEVVQNIYGLKKSMESQELLSYILRNNLYIIVRSNNTAVPAVLVQLQEVFSSDGGQYRVFGPGANRPH